MNSRYSSIASPSKASTRILESAEQKQNIQILARCISTALNLGSPLRVAIHYTSQAEG
jgi:hypothetical protein